MTVPPFGPIAAAGGPFAPATIGASAAGAYRGTTTSGAPVVGVFALGDWVTDQMGRRWTCTVAGTPGTWVQEPGTGGSQIAANTAAIATETSRAEGAESTLTTGLASEITRATGAESALRTTVSGLAATAWLANTAYPAETFVTNGAVLYQAPSGGVPSRVTFTPSDWTELATIALPVGTTSGTVAAGNDSRFAGSPAGTAGASLSATDATTTNTRTPSTGSVTSATIASGGIALPTASTAATQSPLDSSTRLATTAYTDAATLVEKNRATTAEASLLPGPLPGQVVSTSITLTVNTHAYCNAASGALSEALPTGQPLHSVIVVEKSDSSVNTVTATGSVRGVGASSLTLKLQNESTMFEADSSGSWWPIAGHKTLSSLDARYQSAGTSVQKGTLAYLVTDYGVKCDLQVQGDAAMTAGQNVLACTTSLPFRITDVGKTVVVVGAGAVGEWLTTTIAGFTDSGHVTTTANAVTIVAGAIVAWATDDTVALQALAASISAQGYTTSSNGALQVIFPSGLITSGMAEFKDVSVDIWLQGWGLSQAWWWAGPSNTTTPQLRLTDNIGSCVHRAEFMGNMGSPVWAGVSFNKTNTGPPGSTSSKNGMDRVQFGFPSRISMPVLSTTNGAQTLPNGSLVLASLPSGTPGSGTVYLTDSQGNFHYLTYTGTTAGTTITGCVGGLGPVASGTNVYLVAPLFQNCWIAESTTGTNGDNDQALLQQVDVWFATIGLNLTNTQNVNNVWQRVVAGQCGTGIKTNASTTIIEAGFLKNILDLDVENGAQVRILGMFGEGSAQWIKSRAGATVDVKGGYWQLTPTLAVSSYTLIDATDNNPTAISFEDFHFANAGLIPSATVNGTQSLPLATFTLNSIPGNAPASGNITVRNTTNTWITLAYTGVSGNTLTGVTGGSGTIGSGNPVYFSTAATPLMNLTPTASAVKALRLIRTSLDPGLSWDGSLFGASAIVRMLTAAVSALDIRLFEWEDRGEGPDVPISGAIARNYYTGLGLGTGASAISCSSYTTAPASGGLGGQGAYSKITANVAQVLTAATWTAIAGAPSITLPNDGNTYRVELTGDSVQISTAVNAYVGIGTSATGILGTAKTNFFQAATPYPLNVSAQKVAGAGQTVTVYGFCASAYTMTLDAGAGGTASGPCELAAYRVI